MADNNKIQEMSEQGVALVTVRKNIQKAVKVNDGPVTCKEVEVLIEDMIEGPIKDLLVSVLEAPEDLVSHSCLLNGHFFMYQLPVNLHVGLIG